MFDTNQEIKIEKKKQVKKTNRSKIRKLSISMSLGLDVSDNSSQKPNLNKNQVLDVMLRLHKSTRNF